MQIHQLHGLLFHADQRLDPDDNLNRPLSNHHQLLLEAKVLAQHQIQHNHNRHRHSHHSTDQLPHSVPQRQGQQLHQHKILQQLHSRATQQKNRERAALARHYHTQKGRMLHERLYHLLAKVQPAARVPIPAHLDDRLQFAAHQPHLQVLDQPTKEEQRSRGALAQSLIRREQPLAGQQHPSQSLHELLRPRLFGPVQLSQSRKPNRSPTRPT